MYIETVGIKVYTQVSSLLLLEFHCCGAVVIAEGTGSEVNPRVDRPLALVVLALPRVCLLPSCACFFCTEGNVLKAVSQERAPAFAPAPYMHEATGLSS